MPDQVSEFLGSRLVRRPRWRPLSLACVALAVGLVVGGCTNDGDEAGPSVPPTTGVTPQTEGSTTSPSVQTSSSSTSTSTSTSTSSLPPGPFAVHAANPPAIVPEVLYQASVGAGVDQLGLEDCRECDPAHPLSPLVTADGRVVILDAANQRWVTVTDGVPTAVPLPADLNVGQMILGPGDMIYVTMSPRAGGPTELVAFDSRDLGTIVSRQPVDEPSSYPAFRLDGGDIILWSGQGTERRLPLTPAGDPPLPSVKPFYETEPPTVTVTGADGVARVYVFDAGMNLSSPVPLRDGSVVVFSNQTGDTASPHTIVYRLHPDGSISSGRIDGEDNSYNLLEPFVDELGVVELRQRPEGGWQVVRFPFTG